MTKVLVCGGRDFNDAPLLKKTLDAIHGKHAISEIISGADPGASTLASHWAAFLAIPVSLHPVEWANYRVTARAERDKKMLREGKPDMIVVFHGDSRVQNLITQALEAGIPVLQMR